MPTDGNKAAEPVAQPGAESEHPDERSAPAPQRSEPVETVARPRGRLLGSFALLVGVAGLAGALYLYYLLIHQDPLAPTVDRVERVEEQLRMRDAELAALEAEQRRSLDQFAARQRQERDAAAERLLDAVNQLATQAPPSRREWKVAEVGYLLRIANHRLLMERDVAGALTLLKAADAILVELDDFSLYQVRARLSDEILSLENVESNDVQGLFLRLEAVKNGLGRQSLRLPRLQGDESGAADAPTVTGAGSGTAGGEASESDGIWSTVLRHLDTYLRFRRFDGEGVRPLLAPEEAVYLELNLRLMLERAQLAALRREQLIYEQSLSAASEWVERYMDVERPAVRRSLDELAGLSDIVLERDLPDISGSLTTLQSLGEL